MEIGGRANRVFLLGLGLLGVLVGLMIAAYLVIPLQPPLSSPVTTTTSQQGGYVIISMPQNVGVDNKLNFSPSNLTVIIGINNTIIWVNDDSSAPHTVKSLSTPQGGEEFSSPIMRKGDRFNVTLTVPGVYEYECTLHPLWMRGVIHVKSVSEARQAIVIEPVGAGDPARSINFQPPIIRVVIGVNNTVIWVNQDNAIHTVTATDKSFDSGNMNPGDKWSHTFNTPGNYTYFCIYHPWMKGTVIVKQSP